MSNSVPKCTRIMITSIYADGSSVVLDIPEPISFDDIEIELDLNPDRSVHSNFVEDLPPQILRFKVVAGKYLRRFVSPIPELS